MDRGWYIIVGCGTVCGGPYETKADAASDLEKFMQDNRDFSADAYEIVYENGMC
jgi:hypothetical protein